MLQTSLVHYLQLIIQLCHFFSFSSFLFFLSFFLFTFFLLRLLSFTLHFFLPTSNIFWDQWSCSPLYYAALPHTKSQTHEFHDNFGAGKIGLKSSANNRETIDTTQPSKRHSHVATGFCKYFTNIGPNLANKIPMTNSSFSSFLTDNTNDSMNVLKLA